MVTEIKDERLIQFKINSNSLQQICRGPTRCRINNPGLRKCPGFCFSDKGKLRRKGFIGLTSYIHHWGMPEQEFNAGNWKQKLKQRPWRIDAYWMLSIDCSVWSPYATEDHLFRCSIAQSGLGALTSVINQEMPPFTCPLANLIEENHGLWLPLPKKL